MVENMGRWHIRFMEALYKFRETRTDAEDLRMPQEYFDKFIDNALIRFGEYGSTQIDTSENINDMMRPWAENV